MKSYNEDLSGPMFYAVELDEVAEAIENRKKIVAKEAKRMECAEYVISELDKLMKDIEKLDRHRVDPWDY